MTLIFWLLVFIASLCGVASTMVTENGGLIFFAGYFLSTAVSAVVVKYQKEFAA